MSVEKAREEIRKAFSDDPDFRGSYVANITMMLYDNFPDNPVTKEKKINFVNDMGERLLDLVFGK